MLLMGTKYPGGRVTTVDTNLHHACCMHFVTNFTIVSTRTFNRLLGWHNPTVNKMFMLVII